MGMRVGFAGLAVGGPTRVPDADAAVQRRISEDAFEVGELSFGPKALDAVVRMNRDTGTVVPSVLQASQPIDQDFAAFTGSGIADNSAHQVLR